MPLLLLTSFVTVSALVWTFSGARANALRARFGRYAMEPAVMVESVAQRPGGVRLPRYWEAFLARAGVEWLASQALMILGLHAAAGFALGSVVGAPAIGGLLGMAVLLVRLRLAQAKRTHQMAEQLPDALMLMATALKSGLGFQQALQLVANEGPHPLAPEMGRLATDLKLGVGVEDALVRLQTRLGSTDGEMLTSALLVQRQTGGNLAEILLNLHDTVRDRQMVQGQVRTLTAQGRLSGVVLTGIPVFIALAFYMLNREYLMVLVLDPRGRIMTGVALVLLALGVMFIRRIVKITL